jgi:hypothetical protein
LDKIRSPAFSPHADPGIRLGAEGPKYQAVKVRFDNFIAGAKAALAAPSAYQGKARLTPLPPDHRQTLLPAVVSTFYGISNEEQLLASHETVLTTGIGQLGKETISGADILSDAKEILKGTYAMTGIIATVGGAKAGLYINEDGVTRDMAKRDLAEINASPQPEAITDMMRQFVPRFVWLPHKLPENLPLDEIGQGTCTRAETGYLSTSAELDAGGVPYHVAMRVADDLEAAGYGDEAYATRIKVVAETLADEKQRFNEPRDDTVEIPYFNMILPAALTSAVGPAPRNAPCDYAQSIAQVVAESWERAAQELQAGSPGIATKFLDDLNRESADGIGVFLAGTLLNKAEQSDVSLADVVRGLRDHEVSFIEPLMDMLTRVPDRQLIKNDEIAELATQVGLPGEVPPTGDNQLAPSVAALAGADVYSFTAPLDVLTGGNVQGTVTVGIDPELGRIDATIARPAGEGSSSLQVVVELNEDKVVVQSIDDEPLPEQTVKELRSLVGRAVAGEQQRVNDAVRATAAKAATPEASRRTQQARRQGPRQKTRGTPSAPSAPRVVELSAEEASATVTLVGFNTVAVRDMMADKGIKELDAGYLVGKVLEKAKAANEATTAHGAKAPFGKRLMAESVPGGKDLKIRQVSVIAKGGRRQIRVLFDEKPGGRLDLVGIYDKKGSADQTADLRRLAKNMRQKRQDNDGQDK